MVACFIPVPSMIFDCRFSLLTANNQITCYDGVVHGTTPICLPSCPQPPTFSHTDLVNVTGPPYSITASYRFV